MIPDMQVANTLECPACRKKVPAPLCPECGIELPTSPPPYTDSGAEEMDRRGIALPARRRIGGIISPQ